MLEKALKILGQCKPSCFKAKSKVVPIGNDSQSEVSDSLVRATSDGSSEIKVKAKPWDTTSKDPKFLDNLIKTHFGDTSGENFGSLRRKNPNLIVERSECLTKSGKCIDGVGG